MNFSKLCLSVLLVSVCTATYAAPKTANKSYEKELPDGRVMVSGLIDSVGRKSLYLRHAGGETEVRFSEKTKIALEANWRQLGDVTGDKIIYKVHSSNQTIEFPLPDGPRSATKTIRAGAIEKDIKAAKAEKWMSAYGVQIYLDEELPQRLPTKDDPRFVGSFSFAQGKDRPAQLKVGEDTFDVSMKKGGQTHALIFGLLKIKDCEPYVNRARVIGRKVEGDVIADEIHVLPIGDQTLDDNLALPRYLVIGDSISGNYDRGLREALKGKMNVHHPPTNCGPSAKGANSVISWLGAYEVPGRHWDVISFNFGHWDAHNTKEDYQENLEIVIKHLRETGARLVWVTTCPVPNGYEPADDLDPDGNAPGRKSGVMEKYLNPWAAEVLKRHKDIMLCDQWKFVKDHEKDIYKEWWQGQNVHFSGKPAAELGKLLAKHVLKKLKEPRTETVQ
jgi:hypothetical protein